MGCGHWLSADRGQGWDRRPLVFDSLSPTKMWGLCSVSLSWPVPSSVMPFHPVGALSSASPLCRSPSTPFRVSAGCGLQSWLFPKASVAQVSCSHSRKMRKHVGPNNKIIDMRYQSTGCPFPTRKNNYYPPEVCV